MRVQQTILDGDGAILPAAHHCMLDVPVLLAFEQFVKRFANHVGSGPQGTKSDAARLIDDVSRVGHSAVIAMNTAAHVVHEDRHFNIFFVAEKFSGAHFVVVGFVRRDFVARVRLADISKEELDILVAIIIVEVVHTTDGTGSHGASHGTEGEHDIFVAAKIAQLDFVAVKGARFKVRGAFAGLRTAELSRQQLQQSAFLKGLVVVLGGSEHGVPPGWSGSSHHRPLKNTQARGGMTPEYDAKFSAGCYPNFSDECSSG